MNNRLHTKSKSPLSWSRDVAAVAAVIFAMPGCLGGTPASSTQDLSEEAEPAIVIQGSEMAWAAELYDAMKAAEEPEEHETLTVHRKTLAGLTCRRYSTGGEDPIMPETVQHACEVRADLTQKEMRTIFSGLDVEERTSWVLRDEVKTVGTLVIVKSDDDFRLFQNTECRKLSPGDTTAARKCLQFWASEVYPSYEEDNVADASGAMKTKERLAGLHEENLPYDFIWNRDYFAGALVQATDEGAIALFTLTAGEFVVPEELEGQSLADLGDENGFTAARADEWSLGLSKTREALDAYVVVE